MGGDNQDLKLLDEVQAYIKDGLPNLLNKKWKETKRFAKEFKFRRRHAKYLVVAAILWWIVRTGFNLGGFYAFLTGSTLWVAVVTYVLHWTLLMRVIGFTGSIATGKSLCTKELAQNNAQVIDFDKLAHDLYWPGMPAWSAIRKEFGDEVLWINHKNTEANNHANWTVNRQRLGQVIFNDAAKRRKLNRIMLWPLLKESVMKIMYYLCYQRSKRVVLDAPLLYERRLHWICDHVVCVSTDPEQQLRRLMARDHITEMQARAKIAAQMSTREKARMAHTVINNVQTPENTYRHLNEWWWAEEKLRPKRPSRLSFLSALVLAPVCYLVYRFFVWL